MCEEAASKQTKGRSVKAVTAASIAGRTFVYFGSRPIGRVERCDKNMICTFARSTRIVMVDWQVCVGRKLRKREVEKEGVSDDDDDDDDEHNHVESVRR